jgi:uncharacterized protein DUF6627
MRTILPKRAFGRAVTWILVITTLAMGMAPPDTVAMLAPGLPITAESAPDSHRMADLQKIQTVLETKVVRQRLEDLGLSPEEITTRLAKLSDDQLHQLATRVDAIIPAGDGLGIVIALLVIAILAVILIYLLNHRIIITKGDSGK